MTPFAEVLAIFIPIIAIILFFTTILKIVNNRHQLKLRQLDREDGVDHESITDLKEEVNQLTLENAAIKRQLITIKKELKEAGMRINLSEYEREQLKIDQNDKFTF